MLAASSLLTLPRVSKAAASTAPPIGTPRLAPRFGDGRDWWFEKRFGSFIHWELYAIRGGHKQEQWRTRVPRAEYVTLAQQWNPKQFNPNARLDLAIAAGMKYICFTTRHHDVLNPWNTGQGVLKLLYVA